MDAVVCSVDGVQYVRQRVTAPPDQAAQLGEHMAKLLVEGGARGILKRCNAPVVESFSATLRQAHRGYPRAEQSRLCSPLCANGAHSRFCCPWSRSRRRMIWWRWTTSSATCASITGSSSPARTPCAPSKSAPSTSSFPARCRCDRANRRCRPSYRGSSGAAGLAITYVAKEHNGVASRRNCSPKFVAARAPPTQRPCQSRPGRTLQRLGAHVTEIVAYKTLRPLPTTRTIWKTSFRTFRCRRVFQPLRRAPPAGTPRPAVISKPGREERLRRDRSCHGARPP